MPGHACIILARSTPKTNAPPLEYGPTPHSPLPSCSTLRHALSRSRGFISKKRATICAPQPPLSLPSSRYTKSNHFAYSRISTVSALQISLAHFHHTRSHCPTARPSSTTFPAFDVSSVCTCFWRLFSIKSSVLLPHSFSTVHKSRLTILHHVALAQQHHSTSYHSVHCLQCSRNPPFLPSLPQRRSFPSH